MAPLIASIVAGLGGSVLAKSILKRVVVLTLWKLAKDNGNELTLDAVRAVAEALGVPLPKDAPEAAKAAPGPFP